MIAHAMASFLFFLFSFFFGALFCLISSYVTISCVSCGITPTLYFPSSYFHINNDHGICEVYKRKP
uniref:Uncharacterized protein n=1 Tax=Rhizophora mucronata TaxID=61149 RepID=A0A2P2N4V0_RHIMU